MTRYTQELNDQSHLIKIGGMQCSFCVESIRKAYSQMDGVSKISVNLSHEEALIHYDPVKITPISLDDTMRSMGYKVRDPQKVISFEEEQEELKYHRNQLNIASGITLLALLLMIANWTGFGQLWFRWVMLTLSLAMIFGVGWPILKMAIASLRRGIFNQHVLMEFGAFGGLIGGLIGFYVDPWPMADFMGAAIFITTYHILSGYVSLLVRTKSSRAILKLMNLQPTTARVIHNNREEVVPIEQVRQGDRVKVKPGESIPVDGVIVEGSSTVDQSLVTGESLPVTKLNGDEVIGGSINQYGTLLIQVTKTGEESFLQQIVRSVQEARALKPGILQIVERVLKYFVPGVLLAALLAFLIWTLGAWIILGEPNFARAIFATLAVLVMGYPCALGMATPLAMIRGGGLAAEKGILMRSGEAFQIFKDVSIIALDKTGTVTEGKPKVVEIFTLNGTTEERLISITATVEQHSEHPIAQAIVEYAQLNTYDKIKSKLDSFQSIAGLGVEATIEGEKVIIGSPRFLEENKINVMEFDENISQMEGKGWTVIATAQNTKLIGFIAIADTIKPDAIEAINQMHNLGLEPILITGDNEAAANFIANQVGINKVIAQVLPQEKAEIIRKLQENKTRVVMVGDGINDAPALMQADIGIAFNAGTDIAIESADIILVNNNLSGVINAYHIAKKSFSKTKQNVIFAFAFNGIGVPLAITGLVHPVFAMIAMATSVTTVLLNSYSGKFLPGSKNKLELERKGNEKTQTHQIIYSIPTIHCQGCIDGLNNALEDLSGVLSINGDHIDKKLKMDFQTNYADLKLIKSTIESNGHKIESIEYL